MPKTLTVVVTMFALWLSGAVSLQAHHAFAAEFDAKKPVHCEGTITKMEWTNPHVWLHIDVETPDGKVENWAFEAGTPNVLFRRGKEMDVGVAGVANVQQGTPGLAVAMDRQLLGSPGVQCEDVDDQVEAHAGTETKDGAFT